MQVGLARLLLRSQVAALQSFGALPAQPLAPLLGTSGLHCLAEGPTSAAQQAPGEPCMIGSSGNGGGNAPDWLLDPEEEGSSGCSSSAAAQPLRSAAGARSGQASAAAAAARENRCSNLPPLASSHALPAQVPCRFLPVSIG
jgi:hypothetical protein